MERKVLQKKVCRIKLQKSSGKKLERKKLKVLNSGRRVLRRRKLGRGLKLLACDFCGKNVEVGEQAKACICSTCTQEGTALED